MKFLCDAERCIECNACVTACKNEHEVPWGVNRRRVVTIQDGKPGERSISVACCIVLTLLGQFVLLTVFIKQIRALFFTQKTFASFVDIAFMHVLSVLRSIHKLAITGHVVKWISAHSALGVLKKICQRQSTKNMVAIVWQRVNCQYVQKCALQKHLAETGIKFPISSASVLLAVGSAPEHGAGEPPTHLRAVKPKK